MSKLNVAEQAALQVVQEAIQILGRWSEYTFKSELTRLVSDNRDNRGKAVVQSKKLLGWKDGDGLGTLSCLFDLISLEANTSNSGTGKDNLGYYWKPDWIDSEAESYPKIPYPVKKADFVADFNHLKREIREVLDKLDDQDWNNLSLLSLILEKYGSFISFGELDIAFVDIIRSTAAIAAILASNPESENLTLIAGDLSGIQKFIYTISADGALKSLRARSFYLELVIEEVVQQILESLELPRTNVIYAGGGNLYILAPGGESVTDSVQDVRQQFNQWLLQEFQGKLFLALDYLSFSVEDINTQKFSQYWSEITSKNLAKQKSQKFAENISEFIKVDESHEPCKVCHRDDVEPGHLKPLNNNESDSPLACDTCRRMFDLGGKLLRVEVIVRSQNESLGESLKLDTLKFQLPQTEKQEAKTIYYHLFKKWKQIVPENDTALLVNDWNIEHYQFSHYQQPVPLLLGNYGKETQKPEAESNATFMRAGEMAELAIGIKRVAYLRMDVDRLGQIFARGLGDKQNLPRLAGLSRQMSYFFKVYLNSLAMNRSENIPDNIRSLTQQENPGNSRNILFIYAGGDDLFISGAWNEVVDFAFDIYQCFRAYTGYNSDVTISGGISIDEVKFPLYQSARSSGKAEDAAKDNGRDSLGLFGQVFKWNEWLGRKEINIGDAEISKYLQSEEKPELLGVLPFVERLNNQNIDVNCSRNFVRNLLITAEIQEKALEKFKDNQKSVEALGTRYYLHLPKIAYTLARLPKGVLEDRDFRKSLKSPYNAPYFRAIATWIELLNR
ncbi:type III-A CRISPR-associated protein Cas10/Csm1 [Calothrix sp. NIES-3974]|uniref:type III-A CRISPR-associated protein Cas10/Csm1 n=1 Tax=Calothrix sp. NIES-3974 TaxID=2005462 RepID=UPI000B5FC200|nr:type III-A CRISPR-associated protein Cas10/Csm1 [Calothrix sp. NIES-3974]BAZ05446.1 Csm1 family CRISPR-associated protein [Calothrix sp. NIES-3974]